jgi:hypothetical protein
MSGYGIVTVEPQHTAVVKATVAFADLQAAERAARAVGKKQGPTQPGITLRMA